MVSLAKKRLVLCNHQTQHLMKRSLSLLLLCATLLICSAQEYDLILVGLGTANSIVASRLVQQFPEKQILVLDAGGPTSVKIGGTDKVPYSNDLCYVDVPGEYNNIAWKAVGNYSVGNFLTLLGDKYKVKEASFTWQGMGYGGNSQFNGMLFQSVPVNNMDNWPTGWKSSDLLPYYQKVIQNTFVTPTPSKDGKNYLTDIADAMRTVFKASGYNEVDTTILTSELGQTNGYFSRPYLVTDGNGQRGGIVDGYLTSIIDANGAPKQANLKIVNLAKVSRVIIDATGTATGVEYYVRTTQQDLQPAQQGTKQTATVKAGGRVILGAGALVTPKILYQSGIGPKGQEASLGTGLNFVIDNPAVGSILTDHIGIQVGLGYSAGTNYNYGDYTKNAADLQSYTSSRNGPYSQYAPVIFAHMKSDANQAHPNIEVMVNPVSTGGSNAAYTASDEFQVLLINMDQKATSQLKLNSDGFVTYPSVYFTNAIDVDAVTDALYTFLNTMLPKNSGLRVIFGPGGVSHPELDPTKREDCKTYITGGSSKDGVPYSNMIMNHFTGTVPLLQDAAAGGVDPATLVVRGTTNIHVVDASLYKPPTAAHPVATVMAGAERASDLLIQVLSGSAPTTGSTAAPGTPTSASPAGTTPTTAAPGTPTSASPAPGTPSTTTPGQSTTVPRSEETTSGTPAVRDASSASAVVVTNFALFICSLFFML